MFLFALLTLVKHFLKHKLEVQPPSNIWTIEVLSLTRKYYNMMQT